jgi:CHAD domain-containing protein
MKALKKYADKRVYNLKALLVSAKFSDDPEILHQIRLEIKRLKAVLALLHFEDIGFAAHKAFIPLRKIFREAGKIREPSELRKLLTRFAADTVVVKLIRMPTPKILQNFKKNISGFVKDVKKVKPKILKRSKRINQKMMKKYLVSLDKTIKKDLYPKLNPFTLHGTRKIIKELIYLSPLGKEGKHIPSFFTETANSIGLWHDKQLVLQLLMPNPAANKETIQKLQESCDQELQHLDESIANHYALH